MVLYPLLLTWAGSRNCESHCTVGNCTIRWQSYESHCRAGICTIRKCKAVTLEGRQGTQRKRVYKEQRYIHTFPSPSNHKTSQSTSFKQRCLQTPRRPHHQVLRSQLHIVQSLHRTMRHLHLFRAHSPSSQNCLSSKALPLPPVPLGHCEIRLTSRLGSGSGSGVSSITSPLTKSASPLRPHQRTPTSKRYPPLNCIRLSQPPSMSPTNPALKSLRPTRQYSKSRTGAVSTEKKYTSTPPSTPYS
jgi:hypothetical protein